MVKGVATSISNADIKSIDYQTKYKKNASKKE